MGDLSRRIKVLEQGGIYPERIVQEAMRLLSREELEASVRVLGRVVEEGAPEEVAGPVVRHILALCEAIVNETR